MASDMELLDCPLCDFAVLPADDYALQLHFEQEHTEDSPFVVKDDPEPLPPLASSSTASTHKTRLPQTTKKRQSRVLSLTAVSWSCWTTSTTTLIFTPQKHYHSTKQPRSITRIIHPPACRSQPLHIIPTGVLAKPPAQTTDMIQSPWTARR